MSRFKTSSEEAVQRINRLERDLFDKLYHFFEPPLPDGVIERLEKIVACGNIVKGATVLDVGSGTGILVSLIQNRKPQRIYTCDLSEAMLEQLSKNYPHVVSNVL